MVALLREETAPRPARQGTYISRVQRIVTRGDRLTDRGVRQAWETLTDARRTVLDALATTPREIGPDGLENYSSYQLQTLLASIDSAGAAFERNFARVLRGTTAESFELGATITPESLRGIGLDLQFAPDISRAQLAVAAQLYPDLISQVSNDFRTRVKREISLGVLGARPTGEVQNNVVELLRTQPRRRDRQLGPLAYQAERIVRTEMMTTFNLANDIRHAEAARQVPGLKKIWLTAGDMRVRNDHVMAGARYRVGGNPGPIPIDEDFVVGGELANGPHDPRLSAAQKIHCRCVRILWKPEWFEPIRDELIPEFNNEPISFEDYADEQSILKETFEPAGANSTTEKDKVMRTLDKRLVGNKDFDKLAEYLNSGQAGSLVNLAQNFGETPRQKAISKLVSGWAFTSSDQNPMMIFMQQMAEKEFGLQGVSPLFRVGGPGPGRYVTSEIEIIWKQYEKGVRAFLRAMYENTQDHFKEQGIKEVTLFRGMSRVKDAAATGVQEVRMRSLSAYSWSPSIAEGGFTSGGLFQGLRGGGDVLLGSGVPVERILSTTRTGFGAFTESEMVILGGTDRQHVLRYEDFFGDTGGSAGRRFAALDPLSRLRAMGFVTNVSLTPGERYVLPSPHVVGTFLGYSETGYARFVLQTGAETTFNRYEVGHKWGEVQRGVTP